MEQHLRKAGEQVLDLVNKAGVEGEAFLLFNRELAIEILDGQVDTLTRADEIGIGLRVINQGRLGFAYTSDLSDKAIKQFVSDAVKISVYSAPDPHNILPSGQFKYPSIKIYDEEINSTSLESKIEMARQVEQVSKSSDPRVTIIERAGYEESEYSSLIMNTKGINAFARGNYCGIYGIVVAEEGTDAQSGFSVMARKNIKELHPETVGNEAAQNALRNLNPRTIDSAILPCVIEPYVMTRFLGIIARMVNAGAVQKGKSLLADKQGQAVGSAVFNIIDDATYEGGLSSFPFDSEGTPAQTNKIIEAGILIGFMHDTYTGSKAGLKSTGNGQRGGFRTLPSVGPTNFILQPGSESQETMIKSVGKGIYITEIMGMHTANPVSGDFSVGAQGIMIEKGRFSYPVRGLTIAGNMLDFLKNIEILSNDLRFFGGKASPTVLINHLSIGGD